jgi:hypothetical protein
MDRAVTHRQQIGIILVHGIGEQRRFEHLDGQLRYLIRALDKVLTVDAVSVDIVPGSAAAFHAEQDTWGAGPEPTVTVVVRHKPGSKVVESRLRVHEVWWADVNENYSLAKQFRFWLWGLSLWNHPGKKRSIRASADRVAPPVLPAHSSLYDRFRLFMVGAFFALLGFSIGWILFLANRTLKWRLPDVLRVLTNYLSAVKLYNQKRRFGPGLWWSREEFIDAIGEPPRESVRRRMVRAICDVACKEYDRWYILGHSQGSVVAFNGLMATAYLWPGYLDETRWALLKSKGWAGPANKPLSISGIVQPRRPVWVSANDIAYRTRIFERFRGLLTYGSPIEKFAAIWPARVPICGEPVFRRDIPWINLYDPIDPVSGRLLAYSQQPPECCPRAVDIGYCSSWWLLLAHLKYLTPREGRSDAATATVKWLLTDDPSDFKNTTKGMRPGTWFDPNSAAARVRSAIAWFTWIVVTGLLLVAGAFALPMLVKAIVAVTCEIWKQALQIISG